MAIQKDLNVSFLDEDIIIKNAYFKITNINGNKDKMNIQLTAFKEDKLTVIKNLFFTFTPDFHSSAKEITTQSYDFIKNQKDFIDAVDC